MTSDAEVEIDVETLRFWRGVLRSRDPEDVKTVMRAIDDLLAQAAAGKPMVLESGVHRLVAETRRQT